MPPKHRVVAAAVAAGDSAGGLAPREDQSRPSPGTEKPRPVRPEGKMIAKERKVEEEMKKQGMKSA